MAEKLLISNLRPGTAASGGVLLCGVVERKARSGASYCIFTIGDGHQTVEARLFDMSLDRLPVWARESSVVFATVEADTFNGAPSYIIRKIRELAPTEYDLGEYIEKAPVDSEKMYNGILELLHSVTPEDTVNKPLYELVRRIYGDNRDKLLYWSAAKAIHHSMYGGLLYHTYRMAQMAMQTVSVYPGLDAQLLLAAVALHDIGKLRELNTDALGVADYSLEGKLSNHLVIGIEMVDAADDGSYDPDEIACLKHCLASHHGSLELGALVLPKISEAQVLHYLDIMDSRIQQYEKMYDKMENGAVSSEKVYGLDNVQVYKPLFREGR